MGPLDRPARGPSLGSSGPDGYPSARAWFRPNPRPSAGAERMSTHAPSVRSRVLGVLGGISSGKSRVARGLAGPGGLVIDADRLAHEELATPAGAAFVRERFGAEALGYDGLPSREALARLVFSDAEARRSLEGWIHPRVRARIMERLGDARAAGVRTIVLDVPLLLENDAHHGLARACDHLVLVDADETIRGERARRTRGWAPDEVARREFAQLPLAEKRRRADHVLTNNGTLEELDAAIDALRAELALP